MLPPLQQSAGQAALGQMRSMLEDIETRRQEAEDKARGRDKEQQKVAAAPQEPPSAAANEKINAYFFGALKLDADPFATLISRFTSALGLSQDKDETSAAFARRLGDAVAMLGFGNPDGLGNVREVSLLSLDVSADEIVSVLKGSATEKPSAMAEMAARIAKGAGLTGDEADFEAQMSTALMTMRSGLPRSVASLEEATGLRDLGLNAQDMIAAIASPWSDAGQKVKTALAEKADGERTMTREMRKVIQRLEDVADPKTIEELKQEKTQSEPGRVEDEETRAEREQKILDLQASEKLDDVQDLQEAVKDHLEEAAEPGEGGDAAGSTEGSLQLIQILAAVPTASDTGSDTASDDTGEIGSEIGGVNDNVQAGETAADVAAAGNLSQPDGEALLSQLEETSRLDVLDERSQMLFLPVDEIGIYELLRRKAA